MGRHRSDESRQEGKGERRPNVVNRMKGRALLNLVLKREPNRASVEDLLAGLRA